MQEILFFQNKHWKKVFTNYPLKREVYNDLQKKLLSNKLVLSIEGPRRVGKSILIKQLINYLIKKNINVKDILYFSYDDFKEDIFKLIKEYEIIRGKEITDGKMYFFFDEIQKINDWQSKIKLICDNYPNIKIVVSGSTLNQSKKESLAGRIIEYFLKPLSFREYLIFSNSHNLLNVEIDDLYITKYKTYLKRQYPDLAIDNTLDSKDYVTTIIKKTIYEDSQIYLKDVDIEILSNILKVILRDPGQIINYTDLAKDFNIDRKTISEYIAYLINSGLIRKVYNFSNNARKIEKTAKKFYPFCTTLISFILNNPNESKFIETDVAFQLNAEFFWDNRGVNEIDFIVYNESNSLKIGVEVKYRNQITIKDIQNFKLKPVQNLDFDKKYLIVKENTKCNFDSKKEKIVVLPYYLIWKYFKY